MKEEEPKILMVTDEQSGDVVRAVEAAKKVSNGPFVAPAPDPPAETKTPQPQRSLYDFEVYIVDAIRRLRETMKPKLLEPLNRACYALAMIGTPEALDALKHVAIDLGFQPKTIQVKLTPEEIALLKEGKLDIAAVAAKHMAMTEKKIEGTDKTILVPFPRKESEIENPEPDSREH